MLFKLNQDCFIYVNNQKFTFDNNGKFIFPFNLIPTFVYKAEIYFLKVDLKST